MKRDLHQLAAKHAQSMPGIRVECDRLVWGAISVYYSRRGVVLIDGVEKPAADADAATHVAFLEQVLPMLGLLNDLRGIPHKPRRDRWRSLPGSKQWRRITGRQLVERVRP